MDDILYQKQDEIKYKKDINSIKDDETSNNTSDILHKTELIKLSNGWNDKNESIIISVGENAASYKWMHERCSSYHKVIHKFTSILLIVLTTALTAETIFPTSETKSITEISTLEIIKRLIIYLINLISVLQTFFKSQEVSEKHLNASGLFSNLYHDIQQQMCMFRRNRTNATKYVGECLKAYDSLVINSPDINSFVLKRFKSTFQNSDISLPEIADKIQKIEIITEDVKNFMMDKRDINEYNIKQNSSNKQNSNNLAQIHSAFQIHGDITDKDLENINSLELKELKNKFTKERLEYEYNRFLQHSHEND
jgi:hypothetical protein